MNKDILIISSIYDFSTDLVTQELEKQSARYIRINKENLKEYRFSLDPSIPLLTIKYSNKEIIIDDSLKAVWFRQPIFLRNTPGKTLSLEEQLQKSQWLAFFRSLCVFYKAKWINFPPYTYLAEIKAFQLLVAKELSFNIPSTIIGNDFDVLNSIGDNLIAKSLDTILLKENQDCLFTYSSIINRKFTDEEVYNAPFTAQEYLDNKTDIRVTVVGEKLLPISITNDGNGIIEDWRTLDKNKLEYNDIILPPEISDSCLKLTKSLNLKFAGIDLIKSNNKYYFIEINPTGEWGWLVNKDRRIDKLIALELMK